MPPPPFLEMFLRRTLSVLASLSLALGGCTNAAAPQPNKLEKITVAYMPIPDNAALFIARERGFFAQEGLEIEPKEIRGLAEAVPKLLSGAWQFSLANYVTFFQVEEKQPGKLRLVADAYQAKKNTFSLMVKKDSPLKSLKDLKWSGSGPKKRIGVATPQSVATLTTEITLATEKDLNKDDIEFVFIKLPDMPQAVERGSKHGGVDVGWEVEPYITDSASQYSARQLADAASGPTDQFPIAGWAVSTTWVSADPGQVRQRADVVARFQRALSRGQQIAATDRSAVTAILPTYAHIEPAKASVIALGSFPTTLEGRRLQRVADAMLQFGYLTSGKPINAENVIWRSPLASSSPSVSSSTGATP
ncbi:ABC transporter substrate-binding protein [Nonomuraea turkmeniaca]|uniref:ABC transporter substrate-binding protein n=1 Tax=Nonomuraea turkmeniaca TaxID=103838 RepID=A0A5S4G8Z9_9ACTN|nr:ABC transporter substrate-binding protein [Nonomuraea turkmeniaca]